ncbi:5-guanidino-2-oxopentanoate decarboxylase [Rhodoligotrophos appendicifer]|uniref:5-guanidino-2-oxopentanoate decarboxylase n=1 Tax=Rhodoligotrophos appendicifer TaxID=987056 RepID=UPI001478D0BF|nr:5-guanidino-2-oxopentanoate decarboxylase [Rhodoligotrophos appendicifer]
MAQSTGEALVALLEGYGIEQAFGIPGVHNVELYRALPRSSIRHVLPRHEQGAGFMADGYGRVTGKPAACFTITGPGLTNILTAVGEANSDSAPMLVISSTLDVPDLGQGRGRLHDMIDQHGAAASVAGFAAVATASKDVPDLVARALAFMRAGRPQPAYIEIPIDVLKSEAEGDWEPRSLPSRPQPDPVLIDRAAEFLLKAERPIMVLGGGAVAATEPARRIAEMVGAAVVTTIAGKGIVPNDHPLCLGAILPDPKTHKLLSEADVVLAVGSELAETDFWLDGETIKFRGALIRIDVDAQKIASPHSAALPILADAKPALEALVAAIGRHGEAPKSRVTPSWVSAFRAEVEANEAPSRKMHRKVLEVVRSALPEDTIVVSDETQLAYSANQVFPMGKPASWCHPIGFGTLGYGLPAAIGAKLGKPDRPVVLITGDYSFQFTCQELGTAAEAGLTLPIIVWNSESLAEIHDDMVKKGIKPNAVTLKNPDFPALGRAFNCLGVRVTSLAELETAIKDALTAKVPTVIEVKSDIVA